MKRRQASKSSGKSVKKTSAKSTKHTKKQIKSSPSLSGPQLVARPSTLLPAPPTPGQPDLPPAPPRRLFRARTKQPEYACTFEDIMSYLKTQQAQITLGNDIIVNRNIIIDHDVAIDFNGHSIIADQSVRDLRVFDIRRGEVTLTGEGKIFALGTNDIAVRIFGAISSGMPHYTTVTIDEGIHLYAPEGSGVLIAPNLGVAYGVILNFRGEIIARSGICLSQAVRGLSSNIPEINIRSGARIIADELCGSAIEAAGLGAWYINAAKLFGVTGINLNLGSLELLHTQIIASAAAIAFDTEPDANLKILIDGGIYISETGLTIIGDPAALEELTIKGGDFCGALGIFAEGIADVAKIQDGRFSTNVVEVLRELEPDTEWDLKISPDYLGEFHPTSNPQQTTTLDNLKHDTSIAEATIIPNPATNIVTKTDGLAVSETPINEAEIEVRLAEAFERAEVVATSEEIYTTEYNNSTPTQPRQTDVPAETVQFAADFEEDLSQSQNTKKSQHSRHAKIAKTAAQLMERSSHARDTITCEPDTAELQQAEADMVADLPIEALEAWMETTSDVTAQEPLSDTVDITEVTTGVSTETTTEITARDSANDLTAGTYSDEDANIIAQAFVDSEPVVQLPTLSSSVEPSPEAPSLNTVVSDCSDEANTFMLLQPSDLAVRRSSISANLSDRSALNQDLQATKVSLAPPPAPVMPDLPFFTITSQPTQDVPTHPAATAPVQVSVPTIQARSDFAPAQPSRLEQTTDMLTAQSGARQSQPDSMLSVSPSVVTPISSTPAPSPAQSECQLQSAPSQDYHSEQPSDNDPEEEEYQSLRNALSQALLDMRKLRADDYIDGFSEFQAAMLATEMLLSDPETCIEDIRDAASDLLNALDQLEEADDSSLTDLELDQLFYHGSVLKEFTNPEEFDPATESSNNTSAPAPYDNPENSNSAAQAYSTNIQPAYGMNNNQPYVPNYYENLYANSQNYDEDAAAYAQNNYIPPNSQFAYSVTQTPAAQPNYNYCATQTYQSQPQSNLPFSPQPQAWTQSQIQSQIQFPAQPQFQPWPQAQAQPQVQVQQSQFQLWLQPQPQFAPQPWSQAYTMQPNYYPDYSTYARSPYPENNQTQLMQHSAPCLDNRPTYYNSNYFPSEQIPNATQSTPMINYPNQHYALPNHASTPSISGFFKGISAGFQAGFTAFRKTRHDYKS